MGKIKCLILAAGKGTRMASDLPKVLHKVCDKPMVVYPLQAAAEAGAEESCVIIGYKGSLVKNEVESYIRIGEIKGPVAFAEQKEQLGTGHAVKCAADFIGVDGNVMILCGDTPLITGATLKKLVDTHVKSGKGVTVLSAILPDATGYGRIIRDANGAFQRIVEQKDCTEEKAAVKELNSGMYIFNSEALTASLGKLTNENAQGEYYLTDTISIIKGAGMKVGAVPVDNNDEILGVNTHLQLETAEKIMQERLS